MLAHPSLLVALLQLIDRVPLPAWEEPPRRGRPVVSSERLFLKALAVMLLRRLTNVHLLDRVLQQPTPEMAQVRAAMSEHGRFPSRRTFERRLATMPETLPAQLGELGRFLVTQLQPWQHSGRAVAADSTVLRANGGVWHVKQRNQGLLPHTSIDVEADNSLRSPQVGLARLGVSAANSGWKLHLVTVVASVWIPVAATVTRANAHDGTIAPALLDEVPEDTQVVLGDRHFSTEGVQAACATAGRTLITPQRGPYPHQDDGVEVRRQFHRLRSVTCENFNQVLKGLFELHGQVPTKGLDATTRYVLGAVFVYQLALWYRFEQGLPLQQGLKAFLKAA